MQPRIASPSHSTGWLFCILLALALGGCGRERTQPVELSGSTMGTTWHVTYTAAEGALVQPDPGVVRADLQALLDEVNASMSTYRADSEIMRLNRSPENTWVEVSAAFLEVLEAALEVGEASGGAYDVSVGPLVDLWGFGPGERRESVPGDGEIAAALERVGQQSLQVDAEGGRVRKQRPLELDFSSIAKGYAVDRLAQYLRGQQIRDFMVEVGGELRLSGLSPRGDAWRIAIEQPNLGRREPARALALSDIAMATSGDYRNFFEVDGQRYAHTIDPRSGRAVVHDLVSVTVLAETAMQADAWATALLVLGADQALALASQRSLAVYLMQREGDAFTARHSAAFAPYLRAPDAATIEGSGPER